MSLARTSDDVASNVLPDFTYDRVHASGAICIAAANAVIDDDGVSFSVYLPLYQKYH